MNHPAFLLTAIAALTCLNGCAADRSMTAPGQRTSGEDAAHEERMGWWRDARFGMFIHWGLYAIPAGEWPGKGSRHAEWIRDTAQIPVAEYEKLLTRFNPVKFDADKWVAMAHDAGVRYLVITSKHHDGFCLFDSAQTDWDVMSTPFRRDIMKELSDACKRDGVVRFAMYHSIMDWHHPDYLPRRPWEKAQRPEAGADFDRFVTYLKNQLAEITAPKYDPGLIWFDGEWEGTWTHERGTDLHAYMRRIAPEVIVNNRIDKGRAGMEGETKGAGFLGDYHTPEQTIPERGLPGDWETCMTMNGNWGYNAADKDFKSSQDLIRKLCDIASKGGNFLLNVGPTSEGEFPPESVRLLHEMGVWMRLNGESIYSTQRGPLTQQPAWGRVTMRKTPGGARLYLHVFDPPGDGQLLLPGLLNTATAVSLIQSPTASVIPAITTRNTPEGLVVDVSGVAAGALVNTGPVVVYRLDIKGEPDVSIPPEITAPGEVFVTSLPVSIATARRNVVVRYTVDGSEPTASSAAASGTLNLTTTTTIKARGFRGAEPVSATTARTFTKQAARPAALAVLPASARPGLKAQYYQGDFNTLPDFASLKPAKTGVAAAITLAGVPFDDFYAVVYTGWVFIPRDDAYYFNLGSDDGSRLFIGGQLVIDNDGLHSLTTRSAAAPLAKGWHPIRVEMFEKSGGADLALTVSTPGAKPETIPVKSLAHEP
ncbi:MAG: alpha-L-fucosidase [Phycisphaerae bacterium]|nr:alpha-L-fucosidase [Phycisphaerae bacterium]